ncbi:cardiolipin synthase [Fundidesulfovibrio agrisoli]|uniref:cardiolipin synthase n=1 Tax=Fundidesulfovibrio agrisoli TaxID=2922717 RepID=UPI001FAB5B74|nr:cardiolipin synthase [Fundidesulfovibrio agrisoli]
MYLRNICLILCVAATCGCASLPDANKVLHADDPEDDVTPIIKKNQKILPPRQSKAIIRSMENKVDGTEILQRHIQSMQSISDIPLEAGNKVTLLIDGEATYAAMLKAIENAKDSINFETFILDNDEIGATFAYALMRKASQGVQVNLMYDSYGSRNTPPGFFQRLRDAGILVLEFNPMSPGKVHAGRSWQPTHRDHRKILVVDGTVAFTGGVNISNVYSGTFFSNGRQGGPWRDTHLQIEGPAVSQVQKLFLQSWEREEGPALPERNYFPNMKLAGKTLVRVIGSLPGENNRLIYLMYISAIAHASNSIYITTPYFVIDKQMLQALTEAASRGVDVKILLPHISDSKMTYYASRHYYQRLLEAGVQLFERRDRMLHAKTAVFDNVLSTVGSSNLDTLSLLKNDEVNAIILGKDFADALQDVFEKDLGESDEITLDAWKTRPEGERLKESFSIMFKHWL